MVNKHRSLPVAILICTIVLPNLTRAAGAQEPSEPTRHWAYAAFFGTGWYKLNEERSSFILRISPRWTVGDAGFDERGKRQIGYTFQVPVTIGFAQLDFDDVPGIVNFDNFTTASAGFIADADIPLTSRFSIRPSAQLSYGTILDESDYAWTYKTELKSRYVFQSGKLDWSLLADLGFVGYEPNRGDSDDFAFIAVGAEFGYPVSWFSSDDSQTMLYSHIAFTEFLDEIEFQSGIDTFDSIASYWQVGAALGKRDRAIRIWRLKFDRLGLALKISSSSDLRGVKFIFRSLYEL